MDQQRVPRSQAAKDRIVAAARTVFAEVGYDRATVRQIAERAAVAPAMLIRYFGDKAGVFATAIQFDLALPVISPNYPHEASKRLVAHFLLRWRQAENGGDLVALLRASVDHKDARDRMAAIFVEQLVPVVSGVSGAKESHAAAALIASQMLGLAYCRFVLDLPALRSISDEELIDQVGSTIAAYLVPRSDAGQPA